jgi:hypothetical protein
VKYLLAVSIAFHCIQASATERPSYVDDSINELHLLEAESGKDQLQSLPPNCKDLFISAYCYVNTDRTQKVMLLIHPGDYRFRVAEVLVEKASGEDQLEIFPRPIRFFLTAKGIRLGLSQSEVIERLGEPHRRNGNNIQYRVENDEYLLDEYNMPIYYGNYTFENGELVSFRYGFEYP